jgi:hypothetical protein
MFLPIFPTPGDIGGNWWQLGAIGKTLRGWEGAIREYDMNRAGLGNISQSVLVVLMESIDTVHARECLDCLSMSVEKVEE